MSEASRTQRQATRSNAEQAATSVHTNRQRERVRLFQSFLLWDARQTALVHAGSVWQGRQAGRLKSAWRVVHIWCHMQQTSSVGTDFQCVALRTQAQALAIEGYRSGKRAGAAGKASLSSLKELVSKGQEGSASAE